MTPRAVSPAVELTSFLFLQGNHFDQYEEGHLEIEQASLDKPIESVRYILIIIKPPKIRP